MNIEQRHWSDNTGWSVPSGHSLIADAQLVLAFGGRAVLEEKARYDEIRAMYPNAHILLSSTSGEILGTGVYDDTIAVTAVSFERTTLKLVSSEITSIDHSYQTGKELADAFEKEGLVHVFVISDGQRVNGSAFVKGLNDGLPAHVSVTGGLAGDGSLFQRTVVGLNAYPAEGKIAAIGFYGPDLTVTYGSFGGWDSFGPERLITKSKNNVLYELDGQSALDLYKKYLGEQSAGLPGTALLFPLSISTGGDVPVVRTILSIDEQNKSMTFAGDMPEGMYARLMKANVERLIDGASRAAVNSAVPMRQQQAELAILISCVGRKLVLGQRIEEEVEGVREVFGTGTALTGFYSYGEISPFTNAAQCELHNQTMTVTAFSERNVRE
ncbi:MAG: FIST signal transduction protein [Bacteroidota bacterium]